MNSKFKIIASKLVKFIVILALVDFSVGYFAKRIYFDQKTGKQARITYSINKASSDIMIFGSSHANRHYVPEIFENQLNKSSYNAGVQGQGIIFHTALLKMILKRNKPELIILNIDYNWLYKNKSNYDRLSDLHPYYWDNRNIIKPVISQNSKFSDLKLLFKSYQMNSTLVHALRYSISPQKDYNGYLPLNGELGNTDKLNLDKVKISSQNQEIDVNFKNAFENFIITAKNNNINLVIAISPFLENRDLNKEKSYVQMKAIANKEKIPVFNLFNDSLFQSRPQLFNDRSHLNHKGATEFSKHVSELIKATNSK